MSNSFVRGNESFGMYGFKSAVSNSRKARGAVDLYVCIFFLSFYHQARRSANKAWWLVGGGGLEFRIVKKVQ